MTIIKNTSYVGTYPFKYLDQELVKSLKRAWIPSFISSSTSIQVEKAPVFIELYADLNNCHINLSTIETNAFQGIIEGLASALKGDSLVAMSRNMRRCYFIDLRLSLINLFNTVLGDHPEWLHDLDWEDIEPLELAESTFDQEKVLYWSGWPIRTRKDSIHYLDLSGLYHSHGKEFTLSFYSRWHSFFAKQARANFFETNYLARFLVDHSQDWPPSTFDNPLSIQRFFQALLRSYFLRAHDLGLNLNSRIKSWNRMASNIQEIFFQSGVWPEPFGSGIPKVSGRKVSGALTRISKNSDGVEVHNKLVTDVPLQYTDDQTIEILFRKISADLSLVEHWARSEARDLRKRQLRRVRLAQYGEVPKLVFEPVSVEELGFENVCAIFEHYGFGTKRDEIFTQALGFRMKSTPISHSLGLPETQSLLPFMLLLVIENPKITHAFLKDFELYNEKGQRSGFVKDEAGYHLTGYKDRRKPSLSEMKIFLSPRSASLVQQVIEITAPLREFLKRQGDDNWRKLFLTCGRGWSYPRAGVIPEWNQSREKQTNFEHIRQGLSLHTDMRGEELKKFMHRVSLASVRASRGVQIYLETKSVQQMADALGHSAYSPTLLNHYLPESILAFFQTRWIRIFQRAIVCEALKDSPYLMKATGFESMVELHEFLKNHALKDIPSHLSDPEGIVDSSNSKSTNDQVLIAIDQGILAALLSLNQAVKEATSKNRVSGLARYWSDVSRLIEKEIQDGSDALLKEHLSAAMEHVDPQKMEGLIYDTAA